MSKFDQMRPIVNAKINADDTITTLNGEPIDMEAAGPIFKTYRPLKNQMINPDDSLSPLNFGGGSEALTNITSTGGTIEITGNSAVKNIEVKINANDKILSTSGNGILSNLSINYNSSTGELSLLGKNNQEIGKVNLAISSFLENAEVIANPSGQPEGTYLVLTFKKASGDENKTYINVNTLVDVYTSGNRAIEISSDNKISLKIDTNSKLEINEEGLGFANGYGALSDEDKEKYDNYETKKQDKLTAGDLIEINEATDTISVKNVYNKTETDDLLNTKQDKLTAGDLIEINEATDTIKVINVYNKTETDNLLNLKQDKLTAGDLIEINEATDTIKVINVYNKTETDNLLNSKQNKLTAGNNIEIEEKTDESTGEVLKTIINSYSILQVETLPTDNINNKVIYKLAAKNDGGNIIGYDLYYYDEINGFIKITKDKEIIKSLEKTLNIVDNTYKINTDLKNSDNNIIASNELDITENVVNSSTEFSSFTNVENSDKKFITEGYLNKVMTNIPEPINDKDVVNKKYVDQSNSKFLGLYKDNTAITNQADGDIIYNNKTRTYQSFNKTNNTWNNYNDLRTLQSIKSFQTSIGLPRNSPLQLSRRLKQGSTVELEDVLTSNFTRFRWDMDHTTYDNIVNLPQTRKYNGDIFRLKDNSVVMYVCEDFVDENYNVIKREDYLYIIDNRRVNLSPANLIKPYSSNWNVSFNSLGMWLKNDVVEINGYISISGNPSVSVGYNAMFTIDTTKIKTNYIIDASNFIIGSTSANRNDWLLVFTNSKYYSTVLRTETTDEIGSMEVQIYCSKEIADSLNNYGGGLSICGYFLNLIKKS